MKAFFVLIFALICGVATSQFPEFEQQYRQRLSGAVNELSKVVARFDADAGEFGLSREDALQRYVSSTDSFLNLRGKSMNEIINRYEYLSEHQAKLNSAVGLENVWIFTTERDSELTRDTADIFKPAVPVTVEGFMYAAGGFSLGWILLYLLLMPFGRVRPVRRAET
ncbi:DUF2937 family protein [Litorimonas sp.]|uniref:DUF2937 family protein n=1 Tax=Litorimonas sp. TaxID=1892381 RepID=UPI003A87FE91